jgi:hypothetical protein
MANAQMVSVINETANEPYVLFLRQYTCDVDPPAAKFMKLDTPEYYRLASDQCTILPRNGSYNDILNDFGHDYVSRIQRQFDAGCVKGHLDKFYLYFLNSGFWAPDKSSPYYSPNDIIGLNTFQNFRAVGTIDGTPITTSPIIFKTKQWIYTQSGSIYAVGQEVQLGQDIK